jgi:hypothetical protein
MDRRKQMEKHKALRIGSSPHMAPGLSQKMYQSQTLGS